MKFLRRKLRTMHNDEVHFYKRENGLLIGFYSSESGEVGGYWESENRMEYLIDVGYYILEDSYINCLEGII